MRVIWLNISALLLLAGCASRLERAPGATVEVTAEPEWRRLGAPADIDRLDRTNRAWMEGLAAAIRFRRRIGAEGPLLDADAALPRPAPTPGSYMCRLIRLGSALPGEAALSTYKPFFCHVGVHEGRLSITKQTGSRRPAGYLWDDEKEDRMIFLGSLAPGDEEPVAYGDDAARDMAGLFERIGPFRYRLVVPYPRGGAKLEIFELVPAPVQAD